MLRNCATYVRFIKPIFEGEIELFGSAMLSFELSAIDLILVIAVVVLLILYITKLSTKTSAEEKLFVEQKDTPKKTAIEATMPEEKIKRLMSTRPQPQRDSAKCSYGFGYLRKLDKGASIPDECLGCSRIMECYSANE